MVPLFQSAEEAPGDQKWCPSCCRTGWQIQQQQCGAKENGSSIGSAAVPAAVAVGPDGQAGTHPAAAWPSRFPPHQHDSRSVFPLEPVGYRGNQCNWSGPVTDQTG
jgi:hypothetical protein